ncbi:glycosyltransferase [Rhodococcus sp. H29-C3]|uniref:glycosyltransferase n=1 Tax=Rhodococcus sp. H29-C3 TaxID=3046307 RepID=UPI0024B9371C|nr:glycosyltransferase [Rhodococcus sp. H29-C3]MDJ0363447.1 glycosyltransferase [Rhodococcus sp. H29-C3]
MTEVDIDLYDPSALKLELPPGRWDSLLKKAQNFPPGATLWHINSTSAGGGVAEMLYPMIGLARSVGIATRWLVIDGPAEFFDVTKRIDNGVSGVEGDGGPLDEAEIALYERVSAHVASELSPYIRSGDRVVLHDPQTAGLCAGLRALGAIVTWRAHNGADQPNEHTARSWNLLHRYICQADGLIATTDNFRPPQLGEIPYVSIAPFIDPTAAKNRALTESDVLARLERWGIIEGNARPSHVPTGYELYREGPPPTPHTPMVAQISRWDRVKDMVGVIDSFERSIAPFSDVHLTLAGPEVTGVADDPEAADYLAYCVSRWRQLPREIRRRVQLVCLPMADITENALTVNALQRHAVVVTQKSTSEGFGLTVAEAMWKRTPVVATAVGGIRLQIPTPEQGATVPLDAPDDLFGRIVRELLEHPQRRRSIGEGGREHIRTHFLPDTQLIADIEFFEQLSLEVTV